MSTDEKEIRELIATWMSATKAGDTARVLGLMTDDVVFLLPRRPPMRKAGFAAAAAAQVAKDAPKIDGESEIQEVVVAGDWAFSWTKLKVTVTPPHDARAMVRAGHTLSIFRKEGGKWRLARDANLLAPVPDGGK